jgi:hypothetical protein
MSTNQLQGYAKDSWNAAPDKQKKANILQIWNLTDSISVLGWDLFAFLCVE